VLFFVARKAAGAFVHPAFPAPSDFSGSDVMHNSGKSCRENAVARHCEERSDEAIQITPAEIVWIASLRSQ
jgi:hypothetical protein